VSLEDEKTTLYPAMPPAASVTGRDQDTSIVLSVLDTFFVWELLLIPVTAFTAPRTDEVNARKRTIRVRLVMATELRFMVTPPVSCKK